MKTTKSFHRMQSLPQRDVSYSIVPDLREAIHPGEVRKAAIKEYRQEEKTLKLSIKETTPHPFDGIETRHPFGSTRIATIVGKCCYVRVSAIDQNEDRQMLDMEELKIERQNIYIDKKSGKDFNRPNYIKLLRRIKRGDLLYVKSIDRLDRNYNEILEQWRVIAKNKEVDVVCQAIVFLRVSLC